MKRTIAEVLTNGKQKYLDYDFAAREERRNGRPHDVAIATENLLLLKSVFEKHQIRFWLLFGTLLGAVRDHQLIAYDSDTDTGVMAEDKEKIIGALPDLVAAGLIPFRTKYPDDLLSLMRKDEYIDIGLFSRKRDIDGHDYWSYQNNKVYGEHFAGFERITFLNSSFLIPQQPEKLLEAYYGSNWRTPVRNMPAREPEGFKDFEGYSNLIDPAKILSGRNDYVILKCSEHFPNYHDYSDLDILCADRKAMEAHILNAGKPYESKGFTITVTNDGDHEHFDFFPPGAERLNFRFDLLDSLTGYSKIIVDPRYHERVLSTRREVVSNGAKIQIPAIEHDLAIRFMEYIEWGNERPDKKKHFEYVRAHNSLAFAEVLRRHTNVDVSVDPQSKTINVVLRNDVKPETLGIVKPRMDYFMIWGHGLEHSREILGLIRENENFEVVSVVKRHIENMEQFVSDIYACDSVPMHHLVSKTRYLLNTTPQMLFILVKNHKPQEDYYGEGEFRHIQCGLVKALKEEIRNRFNPRLNGLRTEHHVLHASDYESQVEHVLRVLGLPGLSSYRHSPNPELDTPYHIEPFEKYEVRDVALDTLRASIIGMGLVQLEETPHFKYVQGEPESYLEYHTVHGGIELTDDHYPESFDRMIRDFSYGYSNQEGKRSFIVALELHDGSYRILDGVHRASIMKSRGQSTVRIAVPISSSISGSNGNTVGIVFSKDRAMQLDAVLRSFLHHCEDPTAISLKVLFAASTPLHKKQYELLSRDYPSVEFVPERDFKADVVRLMTASHHVMFLVDDNIFVQDFSVEESVDALKRNRDAIGVSLRLGRNTTYCYMLDKEQPLPEFVACGTRMLSCDWTQAQSDFGYPLELSSSLYRTSDVLPSLGTLQYRNPNTLELVLSGQAGIFKGKRRMLLCYAESRTFCNPVNTVQEVFENRSGLQKGLSPESFAEDFQHGYRIDVGHFDGYKPTSCHEECMVQYLPVKSRESDNSAKREPLTSIVLLNYNGLENIAKCLSSIARHTPERHELVIVDNASTDGSLGFLRKLENIKLLENESNRGCPGARAQGMSMAKGDSVVLLDNDTIVTQGWLGTLIHHASLDERIGIIGPRSNYVSGPQIVRDARYGTIQELESFSRKLASVNRGSLSPSSRLVGFCMFIRRQVIDKIGNIDGSFGKFGFEDDDYTWRAQIAGFKTFIANDVFIHHTGGPQGRGDNEYNRQLLSAWELFKKKWNLPKTLQYGSPLNICRILSRSFEREQHFVPLIPEQLLKTFLRTGAGLPASARKAFEEGVLCLQTSQFDRAITLLQHVSDLLRSDSKSREGISSFEVEICLGDCHLKRGSLQDAREHYEQALRLNPESAEACFGLGLCFQHAGLGDVAREMFECACALKPEWDLPRQKILELTAVA